jgi:pyruvate/2-oxoglutarate dehydrogenase complex dihydrolipoamide dehydrogenase (E3) component
VTRPRSDSTKRHTSDGRRPKRVPRLPTSAVLRTETTDDRILGFAMIGAEAGEVMAVVQTAMLADLPYPKLRDAILAHPTMAEGLGSLLSVRATL